ncbi:MAG: sodium:alanine symporter family protein [Solobacterium sp.]|nr:sodium:alanine symporter family protein [Solobacterium sp.]
MGTFDQFIEDLDAFVWGPWMLVLLVGTGLFLTVRLKALPWRRIGYALKLVSGKEARTRTAKGDVSSFSALMTASAATIGTGNIIGVATAMYSGGPGALVWMWISALFGMSTKFAECMLAIKYREVNSKGEMAGGPMYTMKNGFRNKKAGMFLGILFAVFATCASFGIGNMTQANSIADSLSNTFYVPDMFTGFILTVLTFIVVVGGIRSISRVSDILVPAMAVLYVFFGLIVIICNIRNLPAGLHDIFVMAFDPKAVGGGILGTIVVSVSNAMRYGIGRGCFSNESGLGSAAITAACSNSEDPVHEGYIFMMDTFFDTIIICTITGLVIACSGMLGGVNAAGLPLKGSELVSYSFSTVLGNAGKYAVSIGIILFAFSTIIGWEYHGEKSLEFLVDSPKAVLVYRVLYSALVFVGATLKLETVWNISDIMNALMAVPNLISLLVLSSVIKEETERYERTIAE